MTQLVLVADAQVANTTYLWLYVAIGIPTLAGMLIGGYRWVKAQGVRDAKIDQLLTQLAPNGLNTNRPGDILKRTENKVDDLLAKHEHLASQVDRHIGAEEASRREIWREINKLKGGSS